MASVRRQFFNKFLIIGESRCTYCNCLLQPDSSTYAPDNATVDHIVPTCHGGKNIFSNLVLSCAWCNHKKGSLSVVEFLALKRFVGSWRIPTMDNYLKVIKNLSTSAA